MAEVWGGLHVSDLPVAIKILTGRDAQDDAVRAVFRNEVVAVARLMHPGIISILDFGNVPIAVARASEGHLPEGAPYLVMEYAGGGALHKRQRRWSWSAARGLLDNLLDALAHAHARGVVHRDLKPSNVLFSGPDQVKLTDFGIAWVGGSRHSAAGTLRYMAPEQHRGDWAAFGPWTDLYALGCLGWRVVSGRTPFAHTSKKETARAHVYEIPGRLAPRFTVPEGLEAWLHTLLHKDPSARFRCAADARAALAALDPVDEEEEAEDLGLDADGMGPPGTAVARRDAVDRIETPPVAAAVLPSTSGGDRVSVPLSLRGAGLELFGLRQVPLFGHAGARGALWAGLARAPEAGAQGFLIRGVQGIGTRRLARWLIQHSYEVCGVQALEIQGDDLAGGMHRLLGTADLPEEEVVPHLRRRLGPAVPEATRVALARVMAAPAPPDVVADALRGLFETGPPRRPWIVWIDGGSHAPEALAWSRALCNGTPCPVLVLVGVREDILSSVPEAEAHLEAWRAEVNGESLTLQPLIPEAWRDLTTQLGLSASLGAEVARRCGGHPQCALHLVGGWLSAGALESSFDGLRLVAPPGPPGGIDAVLSERLAGLITGLPAVAAIHLERAAALGLVVEDHVWDRACDDPVRGRVSEVGLRLRGALVERLVDAGWVAEEPRGWRFRQPLLRELLCAQAQRADRWAGHHRAILQALDDDSTDPCVLGHHALEAGESLRAVTLLAQGIDDRSRRWGILSVAAALVDLERALSDATVDPEAETWRTLRRFQCRILWNRGHFAEARALAEGLRQGVMRSGDLARAQCIEELALVHRAEGDVAGALGLLTTSVEAQIRDGIRGPGLGLLLCRMAGLGVDLHRLDDAARWAAQGFASMVRHYDDPCIGAHAQGRVAQVALHLGDLYRAETLLDEAIVTLERGDHRWWRAELQVHRGDVLRRQQRWDEAEAVYRDAIDVLASLDLNPGVPMLHLCVGHLDRGAYGSASAIIDPVVRRGLAPERAFASLCTAVALLGCGARGPVERIGPPAIDVLRRSGLVSADLASVAARGAGLAEALGAVDAACALWIFAREQGNALPLPDLVRQANRALAILDDVEPTDPDPPKR